MPLFFVNDLLLVMNGTVIKESMNFLLVSYLTFCIKDCLFHSLNKNTKKASRNYEDCIVTFLAIMWQQSI